MMKKTRFIRFIGKDKLSVLILINWKITGMKELLNWI
jgi:hypothetical protein